MIDTYESDGWSHFIVLKRRTVFTDLWNPEARRKRSLANTTEAPEIAGMHYGSYVKTNISGQRLAKDIRRTNYDQYRR